LAKRKTLASAVNGKLNGKKRQRLERQQHQALNPSVERFAFIIHPLDIGIVTRHFKIPDKVPDKVVAWTMKHKKPWVVSEITGISSKTGKKATGWFIAVPLLPSQFLDLKEKFVINKIIKGCQVAEELGAGIVGLGAFTALVGGGGRDIANASKIAVTTGNTYTTATAIEGAKKAAAAMDIDIARATVAIVGATGSIGRIAAHMMAREAGMVYLVGRNIDRLEKARNDMVSSNARIEITTDVSEAVRNSEIVISATSAVNDVISPEDIQPGAVVCDVARPRDVAEAVASARDDVLVIDGGVVQVPGNVDFHYDIGLPKGTGLACMAETMILALEGRYEDYTIGKDISVEQVEEMQDMADRHGFGLAGFRSFEKALTKDRIDMIKQNARKNKKDDFISP
jgi:predicted amino acid dehydrogenase